MGFKTGVAKFYMSEIQRLAADVPVSERFFLWQTADSLADVEEDLWESEDARFAEEALTTLYQSWRNELTDAEWELVLRRNEIHGGANKNWLLDWVD